MAEQSVSWLVQLAALITSLGQTHLCISSGSKIVECRPDTRFTECDQANNHDLEESRPIKSCELV